MITKCPVCKKKFDVLWPHLWRYKRDGTYICSWGCLRQYDEKKEARTMRNMTNEEKRTAAEMALRGENPLPYLKSLGMANPSSSWNAVRNWARGNLNQDEYEKLPEKFRKEKKAEEPEQVTDEELTRLEKEIESLPPVKAVLTEPDESEIWHVTAIRNKEWGEFYYDKEHGTIDWRNTYGEEVSLAVADWKRLPDLIPNILRALGVEV